MKYWYGVLTTFSDMECVSAELAGVTLCKERPEATTSTWIEENGAWCERHLCYFSSKERAEAEVKWCLNDDIDNELTYPEGI